MTSDSTFFSTVFQSYQDDGKVIMKDTVKPRLGLKKSPPQAGLESGTARSVGQRSVL